MGFIAEIHLSHEELFLQPTIAADNEVTFRHEYGMGDGSAMAVFVSALGELTNGFDAQLDQDPTIEHPKQIVAFEDRTVYRLDANTERIPLPRVFVDVDGYVVDAQSNNSGWVVRAHLPSRDAITTVREYFRSREIDFQVIRLFNADAIDRMELAGLTEKQRDLLLSALYNGYYDIPRRASQEDLANQFEVSTSAISKQLRRAVSQLVVSSLAPEGRPSHSNRGPP